MISIKKYFTRFWMSQVLGVPKTTLVALAHLKAEFIRGRERGRGERGYYVSAATVRERGPFYLSRTRIPRRDITRLRRLRVKARVSVGTLGERRW